MKMSKDRLGPRAARDAQESEAGGCKDRKTDQKKKKIYKKPYFKRDGELNFEEGSVWWWEGAIKF